LVTPDSLRCERMKQHFSRTDRSTFPSAFGPTSTSWAECAGPARIRYVRTHEGSCVRTIEPLEQFLRLHTCNCWC
jgi:hypothetical protein